MSTIGLNRSTTLYLKPALGIEQSLPGITVALSNVYYDTGSGKIKPSASFGLDKLIRCLKDNPVLKIEIDSHTGSRGGAAAI